MIAKMSDLDLIPEDVQSELMMIRSRLTSDYFRIGDIANRLVIDATKAKSGVTAGRIHKAVGRICGKSARTVRYYAESAAFYGDDARCGYAPYLPFSFFDFARCFGDQWEDVLKLALENLGCSLKWLQKNYSLLNYLGDKISEDSPDVPGPEVGLDVPVGGLEYGIRCAQNDLNKDNGNGRYPKITALDTIGHAPTVGMTAAELEFVRITGELLQKAEAALLIAQADPRVPASLCGDIAFHAAGLTRNLADFAKCMDKPVVQPKIEQIPAYS